MLRTSKTNKGQTMSNEPDYVYSDDNEFFNYDSLGDALDCVDTGETVTIYKGVKVPLLASRFFNADTIIENMAESAYEDYYELAEHWGIEEVDNETSKELEKQLEQVIDAWADKHNLQPTWYAVKDVQELKIRVLNDDGDYEIIKD